MPYPIIVTTNLLKCFFYLSDFTFNLYHSINSLILEVGSGQLKRYKNQPAQKPVIQLSHNVTTEASASAIMLELR
jgi:hypothetical protein